MTGASGGRFEGRVALVTGAATGIGLETIRRIVAEGGQVFAGYHHTHPQFEDPAVIPLQLNVTSESGWADAVGTVAQQAGRLDVLVNNAGARESGSIEETTLEQWERMLRINLTSIFLGCRAAVPLLRKSGGGAIVNVGSITGIRGTEAMIAYSASKSGLTAFTASLALDLARDGIRVNAVCPAAIDTRMVSEWVAGSDAAIARVVAKHPLGRIGRPEEAAGLIAFLASADAGFMTGLSVPVDGGRSIR